MGQVSPIGGALSLNHLCGTVVPVVASSAPTWIPGQWWIDSGNGYVTKEWNGSAWVVSTGERYLALLFSSPAAAVNVSDLDEISTAGYSRVQVSVSNATEAYPSVVSSAGLVSWGPFTDDMAQAAGWVAMVTSVSGTGGQFLYWWPIPGPPQQVSASESIQVATGDLQLSQQ